MKRGETASGQKSVIPAWRRDAQMLPAGQVGLYVSDIRIKSLTMYILAIGKEMILCKQQFKNGEIHRE